ncbi:uncharacterized protein LAESUDRAFT_149429 [Laetiporus sulphureus 93-53]|uniref:G-protein coupled receptors family 1 profile domain-containing protein n=1 Tax=Laetiporus sulphureus 93-53 TaxID=1314785 RepID=A0A165EC80_9APHY|nr:uncharacterized protein LAESUDRAFT_149429 [Laetiporus sulphureus 93-53]KZT06712.1 hypothetical protein LAESUDRAFT_149429 [Laetiporus sulphureus 93-53]
MVDWESPEVIANCSYAFSRMLMVFLGVYGWEFLLTVRFEWQLITRRIAFKWPYVSYLAGRYSLLGNLFFLAISDSGKTARINCRAAYRFFSILGCACVIMSSMNLSVRTIIVWRHKRWIVLLLLLLHLGHWAVGITVSIQDLKTYWSGSSCVITTIPYAGTLTFYIYTLTFDSLIMLLTVRGLHMGCGHNALYELLRRQGIWYFAVTMMVNVPALVLSALHLNSIMNIILCPPAETFSVIASSRLVLSLLPDGDDDGVNDIIADSNGSFPLRKLWKSETDELTTHIVMTA